MESLYRKYRPLTFQDVVGQQHVVSTLEHAVLEGRVTHAYLFCGPRGTGKTTMARIVAKALLCEKGPRQLPDGTCEQCRLIAEGRHPDVYELDAASRTGVDNVRDEIINRVNFAPVQGHYKVYIIDEVHMLTTQAFNALLKTLEEPPEYVVFILCTTDPQKIPATILSRVQRFDFHVLSPTEIEDRLSYVCKQEHFQSDPEALALIAQHARGGMRDALGMLEQISVFNDDDISVEAVKSALGEVTSKTLESVVTAIAQRDVSTLFEEIAHLVDDGEDLLQFVRELARVIRDIYVVSLVGIDQTAVLDSAVDPKELEREAKLFGSSDRLARILAVLGDVSNEMRTATNQRLELEIAMTKIARPQGDLTLEGLAERVDELEKAVQALSVPRAMPQRAPEPVTPQPTIPVRPGSRPQAPQPRPRQTCRTYRQDAAPAQRQAAPQATSALTPHTTSRSDAARLQRAWNQVVSRLRQQDAAKATLLTNAHAVADDGQTLTIEFPPGSSFSLNMLTRKDVDSVVRPTISAVFGNRVPQYVEQTKKTSQSKPRTQRAANPVRQAPQPVQPPQAPAASKPAPSNSQPDPQEPVPYSQPAPQEPTPQPRPQPPAPEPQPEPKPAPAPVNTESKPQEEQAPWEDAAAEEPVDYEPRDYDQAPPVAAAPESAQPVQEAPQPQHVSTTDYPTQHKKQDVKPGVPIQEADGIPQDLADMLENVFGKGINVVIKPSPDDTKKNNGNNR